MSFEVRDAHSAHAALTQAEVGCRSDPVEFDTSIAFVIQDPDAHPIEIIEWKPSASPYRARSHPDGVAVGLDDNPAQPDVESQRDSSRSTSTG
jgi:hypothetical protein